MLGPDKSHNGTHGRLKSSQSALSRSHGGLFTDRQEPTASLLTVETNNNNIFFKKLLKLQ